MLEYALVVASSQQAHTPLESQTRPRVYQLLQTGMLSRKAGSTLGAPGFDHFTARLRRHAGAKSVPSLTLESARLKWSFHSAAPVARTGEALAVRDSRKGLNANVTFRCLSNQVRNIRCYGSDPTTVIHPQPLLFLS